MELTLGGMFFYGGIAGLAVTVLASIAAGITLGSGRRKLRRKMDDEYGMNLSFPPDSKPDAKIVNVNEKSSRGKKKLIAGITASVIALTIAVVFIFNMNNQPTTAADMLSLGERYLLEMQFAQALMQFLGVIEIEPMNARAYLGAAEAFIGLGQQIAATNILRQGLELTGDEQIRLRLAELEGTAEAPGLGDGDMHTPDAELEQESNFEEEAQIAAVNVGDIIEFGPYDWRVLDVQGDRALILADRIIGNRWFHHRDEYVTWETSEIRQWLNSDFIYTFDETDRAHILETSVANHDNPWDFTDVEAHAATPGGNDTVDRVFLLSIDEVLQYFGDSGMVARGSTMGAFERNEMARDENGFGIYFASIRDQYGDARIAMDLDGSAWWWMLRSPGLAPEAVASVHYTGELSLGGTLVFAQDVGGGVRPAIWLNLASLDLPASE